MDRYLEEIAGVALLERDEEVALARELRVADRLWRRRALAHPCVARALITRWRDELAAGRQPTTFSDGYASGGAAERVPRIRATLERAEELLDAHAGLGSRTAVERREKLRLRLQMRGALDRAELRPDAVELAMEEAGEELRRAARRERLPLAEAREALAEAVRLHARWLDCRGRLASANLRLVVYIAKGFRSAAMSLDDLVQEGNTGLLRAVEKFDYRRGVRFSSYAAFWIKQAMLRAQRYRGRMIRLPAAAEDRLPKLRQLRREAELGTGRDLGPEEIATTLGLDPEHDQHVVWALQTPASLDAPLDEEGLTLGATIEDVDGTAGLEATVASELRDHLAALVRRLPPRERRVIRRRFGTDGKAPSTLEELAGEFGLSRERVRQIERDALQQLRAGAERRQLDVVLH